ncbi:phospholipase D-like domain-containing protein [Stackebrandtia nassauensis]|uniref:Phospholipase D/Transphosphatidylase n=1 Tax=Stackebrandtia nassauensis (strain DSM 44728 / CIP 108903 / NRRL B-16338 / NBRC 102104 / LLR-40K-21) TaxID=446470 RepID=D3Q0M5_STANL|nr:phospholipase D-like domain-containing protein [Stackebrandtia nassauensis]ADD41761.1 phospholipase D/Transphosphatidylase [Stackebrandtia nassauensis DSM 44728]
MAEEPKDYRRWFDTGDGMRPVTANNRASFFITGEPFFRDLGERLVNEAGKDAVAYFLGWAFDNPVLRPGRNRTTVRQILSHFDSQGGLVRSMLWDNTLRGNPGTTETTKFIAGLSHGAAILDRRTPLAGSHHQKVQIVVSGPRAKVPGQVVGYCGGMDVYHDRIGSNALHDVQCKVLGDAGNELIQVFTDRWYDHPQGGSVPLPPIRPQDPKTGTDLVQVCCTYPRFENPPQYRFLLQRFGKVLDYVLAAAKKSPPGDMSDGGEVRFYDFYDPEKGVQQIGRAVAKAIKEAKQYIYLEDQYLVHAWIGKALAAKLASADENFRIVILVPHPNTADIEQVWRRRRDVLKPLLVADPLQKRWQVLVRRTDRPFSYVHSKTWIFDDELVITGSANADRRGYTYNSETNVVVAGDLTGDRRSSFGAKTVAQELRCRLFAKHLGETPRHYLDPRRALARWSVPFHQFTGPRGRTNVAVFNQYEKADRPDALAKDLREIAAKGDAAGKKAAEVLTFIESQGTSLENWLWDNLEDPDAKVPNP